MNRNAIALLLCVFKLLYCTVGYDRNDTRFKNLSIIPFYGTYVSPQALEYNSIYEVVTVPNDGNLPA